MAIEIVSFPINSMVIFDSYVCLLEGNGDEYGDDMVISWDRNMNLWWFNEHFMVV